MYTPAITAPNTTANSPSRSHVVARVVSCSAYASVDAANPAIDHTSSTGGRLSSSAWPERPSALFRALCRYENYVGERDEEGSRVRQGKDADAET